MAIPIIHFWDKYYSNPDEGLGSSYERVIINDFMLKIVKDYRVKTVLETPSFGFTGISGINSMELASNGCKVTIQDHHEERLEKIRDFWDNTGLNLRADLNDKYNELQYDNNSYDLSWNFSALWFVDDLESYLRELCRVTKRVIVLCVPNRSGIGYLSQKYSGKNDLKKYLKEAHIIPANFIKLMKLNGWELVMKSYIDCPPWPDIGMPKAKFLKKFGLGALVKEEEPEPVSIADYYFGKDNSFPEKMRKYSFVEKLAPDTFKFFWAHHKYFVFEPEKD